MVGDIDNRTFYFQIAQAWVAAFRRHCIQAMNGQFDHFSLTGFQARRPGTGIAKFGRTGYTGVMTAHTEAFVYFFACFEFLGAGVGSGNNNRGGIIFGNRCNAFCNRLFGQRVAACPGSGGRADYFDQQDNNKYGEYEREDNDSDQLLGRFDRA